MVFLLICIGVVLFVGGVITGAILSKKGLM